MEVQDPPTILVLRRKAIRQYPDGQKVALYVNDKYDLSISVPYVTGRIGVMKATAVSEETELDEAVIHHLHHIFKTKTSSEVKFKNGSQARINHQTAKAVVDLHSQLNPENKIKIENIVNDSPQGLMKVAQFASENLKRM